MSTNRNKENILIEWNWKKIKYHENIRADNRVFKRGEVIFVDFGENIGSEQNGIRPCVIIQDDRYNSKSPVLIVAIISNRISENMEDIRIKITNEYDIGNGKKLTGFIDLGQIFTISKRRICSKEAIASLKEIAEVDMKILNIMGIKYITEKFENKIVSLDGKIKYYMNKYEKLT